MPARLMTHPWWQGVLAVDHNGLLVAARPHRRGPIHELRICAWADFDAPGCRVVAGEPLASLARPYLAMTSFVPFSDLKRPGLRIRE